MSAMHSRPHAAPFSGLVPGRKETKQHGWVMKEPKVSSSPARVWFFRVSEKEVAPEKVWNKPFAFTGRKFAHMFVPLSLVTEGFIVTWGGQ